MANLPNWSSGMNNTTGSAPTSLTGLAQRIWIEHRLPTGILLLTLALATYVLTLLTPDAPAERWMLLEAFLVPLFAMLSLDVLAGPYESRQMETLLSRTTARTYYLTRLLPRTTIILALLALFALIAQLEHGAAVALARALLSLGVLHLVMTLTRSISLVLIAYAVWWMVSLAYMTPWAESDGLLDSLFHLLPRSGGATWEPTHELLRITIGIGLLAISSQTIKRDARWLK